MENSTRNTTPESETSLSVVDDEPDSESRTETAEDQAQQLNEKAKDLEHEARELNRKAEQHKKMAQRLSEKAAELEREAQVLSPTALRQRLYLGLGLVFTLFVGWWAAVWFKWLPSDGGYPGVFGDSFGPLTSLFTAFTLGGTVYAIFVQLREVALQRIELALTREVLSEQATAQNRLATSQEAEVKAQKALVEAQSKLISAQETATKAQRNANKLDFIREVRAYNEQYFRLPGSISEIELKALKELYRNMTALGDELGISHEIPDPDGLRRRATVPDRNNDSSHSHAAPS